MKFEILSIKRDIQTVCELLSSECPSWSFFSAKKVTAELKLHFHDSEQDSVAQTKALTHTLMNVVASESTPEIIKEEFADFCKQQSGISLLDNAKPEQVDLQTTLQSISSHLLISPSKKYYLDVLEVEDATDVRFIHVVETELGKKFHSVFEKLFLEDPEETELLILECYSPLFSDFLQIYHYYVPEACKARLEAILINVTEKVTKEPVAVSMTHKMQEMRREIVTLTATVESLQSKLAAQDAKMAKILAALAGLNIE